MRQGVFRRYYLPGYWKKEPSTRGAGTLRHANGTNHLAGNERNKRGTAARAATQ